MYPLAILLQKKDKGERPRKQHRTDDAHPAPVNVSDTAANLRVPLFLNTFVFGFLFVPVPPLQTNALFSCMLSSLLLQ